MKILLDTHIFLWWILDDHRLSGAIREIIVNDDNELYLSAASGWEIAIKAQLDRIRLPLQMEKFIFEQMSANAIENLPITMNHALHIYHLPLHHRDPFDRLLISQAKVEKMPILTTDPLIKLYDVEVMGL